MSPMEAEKPYALEMENRGSYLYAIVGGLKVTPEIALDYWGEIISECDDIGTTKILLEHNFVQMISMQEMLEVIGPVADLLKGHSLAFIDRYSHNEIPEAGKKILRGRDVKMQIFSEEGEAEKWLLAN